MKTKSLSPKTQISNELSKLRAFNFKVYNFNSKKSISPGIKDFCDYVLLSKTHLVFVEVKLGTDKLNEEQKNLMDIVKHLTVYNPNIYYSYITDIRDASSLLEFILSGK